MDSHDPSAPPPHHRQHHAHHHHHYPHHLSHHPQHLHHQHQSGAHQQQQPQPGMMIPTTNSSYPTQPNLPTTTSSQMINPNSSSMLPGSRYLFNSPVPQPSSSAKPLEGLNSPYSGDGSSGLRPGGFSISGGAGGAGGADPSKKKRGRPRKYSPDGGSNVALRLAPAPVSSSVVAQGDSSGTPSSDAQGKKHRGRPPGSGKRQLDALGNCGVGFTPHVILVNAGEDIGAKILAFSREGPRTVCVLSANGSICSVTLRQPALPAGTVTYEGRYEIISLSGSFLLSEDDGGHVRTGGGLSISVAGTDGRVLGGGVAGTLTAATPVQIIVGSFIADGKKPKYMPSVPESRMLSFTAHAPAGSPPSHEDSGASSEDDGDDSPMDRTVGGPSPFNNFSQQSHNVHMYQGWPNSNAKMHPN
ncbi:hypothetical protein Dimus_008284 [Dionaea muscipula]